jgi:hypothetical protein
MDEMPQARADQLVSRSVRNELVVYDERAATAHALSPAAAAVWRECTGSQTVAAIVDRLGLDPALVQRALADLEDRGLLVPAGPLTVAPATDTKGSGANLHVEPVEPAAGVSRREAAMRFAKLGGAALAAPLVYSVAIGPAIAAASPCTATGQAIPKTATCTTAFGLIDEFGTVSPTSACCGHGCANNAGTFVCANSTSGTCFAKGLVVIQADLADCCGGGTCTTNGLLTTCTCN